MKTTDVIKLISSPFRKRALTRKPELPGSMIDLGLQEPVRDLLSVPPVRASSRQMGVLQEELQ
jgi:hypothetical protein